MKQTLTKRVFLKILFTVFPVLFIAGFAWIYTLVITAHNEAESIKIEQMKKIKKEMKEHIDIVFDNINIIHEFRYKNRKNSIKENVQQAWKIMNNLYRQYHNKLSEKELQSMIVETLRGLEFLDGRGYFFISDMEGYSIMHGKIKEIEKKNNVKMNILGAKDVHSAIVKKIFEEKEGFVEYLWSRDGKTNSSKDKKVSYVKYFQPYDWYIGAGDYIEDIEKELQKDVIKIISSVKYGDDGFVFVLDDKGNILSHINHNWVGKNILQIKNQKIIERLKKIKDDVLSNPEGVYVEHNALLLYSSKDIKRISYLKYFKDWKWIISTGVDLNHLEREIQNRQDKLKEELIYVISFLIFVFVVVGIFVYFIAKRFKEKIDRSFKRFEDFFKRASTDNVYLDVKSMEYLEFEKLAEHTNQLVKQIKDLNQTLEQRVKDRTKELRKTNKNLKNTLVKLDYTETSLLQNEKMASLGELVAGVTHEINTPIGIGLTGITHFKEISKNLKELYESDSLSQDEFEDFIKVTNELAETILINLRRASEIIKSFKAVAIDQTNVEKREINVKEYINEVLLSLRNKTKKFDIDFQIECEENLVVNIVAGSLSHILTNLIMNSLIHGFEDKKAGIIKIKVTKIDNRLYIEYSDDGKGIAKENIEKLFKPFFTTKKGKGGSGLGMSIVYKIVTEQLKGKIKFDAKPNSGVKFDMEFPI